MDVNEREAKFMREHIGNRTREQLAHELFGVYLVARTESPDITEASAGDPWPMNLHLADVIEKYVLRRLRQEREI